MKTILNTIVLVRNLFVDMYNWRLLKSEGYTFSTVIEEEVRKFKMRQSK